MDTFSPVVRPLAWSIYAIGMLVILAPLGDLAAGIGSLNPGAVPWRFGAAGLLSGALILPLVGLGLWFAAAVLLQHRGVLRVLSVVSAITLLLVGVILVAFALDALQVRVQVRQDDMRAFDLATAKAAMTFLLVGVVLAVLTVNLHRAVGMVTSSRGARRNEASSLLVRPRNL